MVSSASHTLASKSSPDIRAYTPENRKPSLTPKRSFPVTEIVFDGAGRQYQTRTVVGLNSSAYVGQKFNYRQPQPHPNYSSMSGSNGQVIEFTHQELDESGNAIGSHSFELNHNDTNGISLTGSNFVRNTVYNWYDGANRPTHSANYGSGATNWANTTFPTRPTNVPTTSASDRLVTRYTYSNKSPTGHIDSMIDPKGTETKTWYDEMGRAKYVASNWKDFDSNDDTYFGTGTPTGMGGTDTSEDATVRTTFNGLGNVVQLIAMNQDGNGTGGDDEVTKYYYDDPHNASLVTKTEYPDPAPNAITIAYNLDGTVKQRTDQRGTVMQYNYNDRRQVELEKASTLGAGTDGYVRSISRTYDSIGQVEKVTSHSGTSMSSSIRNEIKYTRDLFGNVITSYQAHGGATNTYSTPKVVYYHDTSLSGSTNAYSDGYRQYRTTYPSGREVYRYCDGAVNDALHRVSRQLGNHDGTMRTLNQYAYNGTSRLVETKFIQPSPDVISTMDTAGTAGYEGWDRFGRTVIKQWVGSGTLDKYTYQYDYASNRTRRENTLSSARSQFYGYDGGHRLDFYDEGGVTQTEQDWKLDAWGNWTEFKYDNVGTTQNRTHNAANEINTISNWANPDEDNAGNMTSVPNPQNLTQSLALKYDAWNRLVQAGTTNYRYDGLHRRIIKDLPNSTANDEHYFYNENWQCLEVRTGGESGTRKEAYVWHPYYIDALAIRYWDGNPTDGNYTATNETQIVLQDANYNVTALTNSSGSVIERYHYSAYGEMTVLSPAWGTPSLNLDNPYTFTGRRFDEETGLYQYRHRYYHAQLGRFVTRDPIEYEGSKWSLYEYVQSSPTDLTDPYGEQVVAWQRRRHKAPAKATKPCDVIVVLSSDWQMTPAEIKEFMRIMRDAQRKAKDTCTLCFIFQTMTKAAHKKHRDEWGFGGARDIGGARFYFTGVWDGDRNSGATGRDFGQISREKCREAGKGKGGLSKAVAPAIVQETFHHGVAGILGDFQGYAKGYVDSSYGGQINTVLSPPSADAIVAKLCGQTAKPNPNHVSTPPKRLR